MASANYPNFCECFFLIPAKKVARDKALSNFRGKYKKQFGKTGSNTFTIMKQHILGDGGWKACISEIPWSMNEQIYYFNKNLAEKD